MRELGFEIEWPKLKGKTFTTFRKPRKDKDWERDEEVKIVVNPRNPKRKELGTAVIMLKDARCFEKGHKLDINDIEAQADGFPNRNKMLQYFQDKYKTLPPLFNKLTLKWTGKV